MEFGAPYARGQHRDERVRMIKRWSDDLDKLRSGRNVLSVEFGQRRRI